jgi:hypothetical protein
MFQAKVAEENETYFVLNTFFLEVLKFEVIKQK